MKNKVLTAVFGVLTFVFIITVSISLPIYLRFFYYMQIESLGLERYYDYQTIKTCYDQMLNYLTLPGGEFLSGALPHTASFADHMKDVKGLFMLNFFGLIISVIGIVCLLILNAKKVIRLCRPFGMHVSFISAVSIFGFFLIVGGLVAIDFEKAFVIFHKLFFPGKDNWLVSPTKDPVIKILPEEFFLSCAIVIFVSITAISLGIIIFQIIAKKRRLGQKKIQKSLENDIDLNLPIDND